MPEWNFSFCKTKMTQTLKWSWSPHRSSRLATSVMQILAREGILVPKVAEGEGYLCRKKRAIPWNHLIFQKLTDYTTFKKISQRMAKRKKYVLRFEVGVVINGDLKGDIYSSIVTFYKLYWWLPFVSFLFTYTFWARRGWFRTPEAARYFLFGIYKRHSSAVSQWPSSHKFKSR